MKKLLLVSFGFLLGFMYKPTIEFTTMAYENYLNKSHVPRFKVGECIKSYGSFESRIIRLLDNNEYIYTVGVDCEGPPDYLSCSTSAAPSKIVDESSIKIDCP